MDLDRSKDPGTWECAILIAAYALIHLPVGAAIVASIVCQFDLHPRPSEMHGVRKKDVLAPRGRYRPW